MPSLARQKMRKPDCGIATLLNTFRQYDGWRSEDAKARLWDCNNKVCRTTYPFNLGQKMRKPDCGIATLGNVTFKEKGNMSEDAKARLWDCNS